tara:strand:+ start:580 stop:1452 length:873 start_codon:yes stop_codon:yes gene_type:complete
MSCNFAPGNPSVAVLLDWGYSVSIKSGRLIVNPNNMPCVKHLTNSHKLKLMVEILQKIGRDALTFHSHSASKYGPTLAGGVTLQFTHVLTGSEAYAIFNANLTRSRNTKNGRSGDPLPTKQFHVAKGSGFCKFWASTGLPPRKLSSYYEYMGKLKPLFFESQDISNSNNRLNSSLLKPLHISFHEVKEAFGFSDSPPTSFRQATDKPPTVTTDKETLQPSKTPGLQADSTAGANYCGKTVIRKKVIRENAYPINTLNSDPIKSPYLSKPKDKFDDSSLWFKPLGVPKLKL